MGSASANRPRLLKRKKVNRKLFWKLYKEELEKVRPMLDACQAAGRLSAEDFAIRFNAT
jgi:hypothetical protein